MYNLHHTLHFMSNFNKFTNSTDIMLFVKEGIKHVVAIFAAKVLYAEYMRCKGGKIISMFLKENGGKI